MRTRDLERRRMQRSGWRALVRRVPPQVLLGAVALAAIVLALTFRTDDGTGGSNADSSVRPTVAPAAIISPPTAAPTPVPKQERIHTVAAGDTLTGVADRYYGDASKWNKIFDANRDILPSSNSLQIGQKLKIPD